MLFKWLTTKALAGLANWIWLALVAAGLALWL